MLVKTHLAIGIFAAIFFLEHMNQKLIFITAVLVSSVLPDLDSGFSSTTKKIWFKPFRLIARHVSVFHSFTFCILVSFILAFYVPVLALPFFLGYALHLLADSWTVEGIKPFWPMKRKLKGKIIEGGVVEESVFIVFALLDVVFFILLFM